MQDKNHAKNGIDKENDISQSPANADSNANSKDIYDKSVEKIYYEICEKRGYFEIDGNANLQKIKEKEFSP